MSKKLVLGLALALVLVSGSFVGAMAQCSCSTAPPAASCFSCGQAASNYNRDLDRSPGTCNSGLTTPSIMGTTGV